MTCVVSAFHFHECEFLKSQNVMGKSATYCSNSAIEAFACTLEQLRQIRVDVAPASSPNAWISRFLTWGTSIIVTDLQPSAELLFRTAAQNNILSEFSEPSGILYARTTPLAPSNLRLGGIALPSVLPVQWDEATEGVGNATVAGYRVSWVSDESGETGEQRCNANAKVVCPLPGDECSGRILRSVNFVIPAFCGLMFTIDYALNRLVAASWICQ